MSQFAFKQFSVTQHHAAMKVSTDGILLGAWVSLAESNRIVDVGTGTGLIALMCKQRSPTSKVHAVELDEDALKDAEFNIEHSPWPDIELHRCAIQEFDTELRFDLMVSNPPYFNASLKGENQARNRARHTDSLSFDALLDAFEKFTTDAGQLAVILPYKESLLFCQLAKARNWFLVSSCAVKATPSKSYSRRLLQIAKQNVPQSSQEQSLVIYDVDRQYTNDFISLCREFYLKM
ncbi:tRNA1(Val) (adenine(37)-N6)-methyltransferase [Pseudoalteromonas piscicida]|uniref:tRNA1(Val) (adenine(37)-N6)-methyltransferase n=1 Tax=Pseudoalteromonas piscicida TaxID=43662 RepID=A0AAD0W4Y1_PSEO7|nr:methyltransferase [Pseudoalteromonas piscicida]ASD66255.1 tRNA (adenosine(37)-N6)-methyltransferase TrmM [Pseudoalteromonas piscicida]AXQ97179.1 methyltransferase domain-containing protein [Pseudoalteromonas piscicida]AXR03037.1 methyltransferase domain-containing protein [Pseudoalteromonas piscicida]